jgi:rhamnogalacturonyl hydrolase YesR
VLRCADPHGYWHQILAGLQAAADNASTSSGLGALLLAMGPLQKVKAAEKKLSAEMKQTVHEGI